MVQRAQIRSGLARWDDHEAQFSVARNCSAHGRCRLRLRSFQWVAGPASPPCSSRGSPRHRYGGRRLCPEPVGCLSRCHRGGAGQGLRLPPGEEQQSAKPCAMRQAITIAAVDDQGLVVPIEGPHVVSPGALPWVLVSATDRHDLPSNALRRLGIVITGEYAPDFGTTCSSPRPAAPTAFRLTMGGSAKDVPNQWKGAVTTLGACRTAFSVGPTGRPDQLGRVPD
jgi:hypothetical protein